MRDTCYAWAPSSGYFTAKIGSVYHLTCVSRKKGFVCTNPVNVIYDTFPHSVCGAYCVQNKSKYKILPVMIGIHLYPCSAHV
jgi:hypothetical protein